MVSIAICFCLINSLISALKLPDAQVLLCPPRHFSNDIGRMGELEPWIDENFIRSVWYNMGEQVNVKMIRDKFSGLVDPVLNKSI